MQDYNPKIQMLAEAMELFERADRLQRQFFRLGAIKPSPWWEPPIDMFGDDEQLGLLVAMPGVAPGDFEVVFEQSDLIVRGERLLDAGLFPVAILRLEIPYGRFERRIPLPAGQYRVIDMQLENGCLRLNLGRIK